MTIKERILASIEPVLAAPEHVSIVPEKVAEAAYKLKNAQLPVWNTDDQLLGSAEETAQYYFFLDSINFCFWGMKGKTRWEYQIGGEWTGGYYAYARAIKDAFSRDRRFFDTAYLSQMPEEDFRQIFALGRNELMLIPERYALIRENFSILQERFNGSALNLIEEANGDAGSLASILVECFPTFVDSVTWKGKEVFFLKRAQIFPSDLSFSGRNDLVLGGLENLTAFADYKLPQLLEALGIIRYSDELSADIEQEALIPQGSQKEIEIRASTIRAIEDLSAEIARLGRPVTTQELDWILWVKAKELRFAKPHHRTITTFY